MEPISASTLIVITGVSFLCIRTVTLGEISRQTETIISLRPRPSKKAQLLCFVFAPVTINKSLNEQLWQAIVTFIH